MVSSSEAIRAITGCVLGMAIMGYCQLRTPEDKKTPISKQYENQWHEDARPDIVICLTRNHVSGCGYFLYKESISTHGEFIVNCYSYDNSSRSYLVWPVINKIMGPYPIEASLN